MDGGAWPGVALRELVIYELHVGTFTDAGTFDAADRTLLDELADLGVTAIELMPVATFPGERGWGYDGVYTSAPHRAYGGPQGLARFVDAAHARGLAVILDVVYNHVGPGSEPLAAFGPYFTDRHQHVLGRRDRLLRSGVREWAIQNAELWVARLPHRRAPPRRDARDLRRHATRTSCAELAGARPRGAPARRS